MMIYETNNTKWADICKSIMLVIFSGIMIISKWIYYEWH